MIKKRWLSLIFIPLTTFANTSDMPTATAQLQALLKQNSNYISQKGVDFFDTKSKGQNPMVTLVSCSDSRVHTSIMDESPEGNLFVINNIGNQISTAPGSVKFGVNHLHTPLLLIVGHSQCGAITAATHDHTGLEPNIVKELDSLHLKPGESNIEGVKENVNNQVALALKTYEEPVKRHELLIVGAVYDFANDMKKGAGKLNIINIQGKPQS